MKKVTLFSIATLAAITLSTTAPIQVNAATYFSETTTVSQPNKGDVWFRNVGDGTDTLSYENGKWVLEVSDSARRKTAYHQYVVNVYEPNAQAISEAQAKQNAYIDSAIKNPNLYQALPDSETMSVYVMRVTDGQQFRGLVRIPKVIVPDQVPIKTASTFVNADVPVMLPVVNIDSNTNSGSESSSEGSSSTSSSSSSSAESSASSSSAQSSSELSVSSSSAQSSLESSVSGSSAQSSSESSASSSSAQSSSESSASSSSAQSSSESSDANSNSSDISSSNSSIKNSGTNTDNQIKNNGSSTATTSAVKTTTSNAVSATTKTVKTTTNSTTPATAKVTSTQSSETSSNTSSDASTSQISSSASSVSEIKKNINNMLPQTDEAKNNLVTFGILTLLVSMIGFISIFRYKDGSKI